jgi:hypothetical protein
VQKSQEANFLNLRVAELVEAVEAEQAPSLRTAKTAYPVPRGGIALHYADTSVGFAHQRSVAHEPNPVLFRPKRKKNTAKAGGICL